VFQTAEPDTTLCLSPLPPLPLLIVKFRGGAGRSDSKLHLQQEIIDEIQAGNSTPTPSILHVSISTSRGNTTEIPTDNCVWEMRKGETEEEVALAAAVAALGGRCESIGPSIRNVTLRLSSRYISDRFIAHPVIEVGLEMVPSGSLDSPPWVRPPTHQGRGKQKGWNEREKHRRSCGLGFVYLSAPATMTVYYIARQIRSRVSVCASFARFSFLLK